MTDTEKLKSRNMLIRDLRRGCKALYICLNHQGLLNRLTDESLQFLTKQAKKN